MVRSNPAIARFLGFRGCGEFLHPVRDANGPKYGHLGHFLPPKSPKMKIFNFFKLYLFFYSK